jgi:hypothetical protein
MVIPELLVEGNEGLHEPRLAHGSLVEVLWVFEYHPHKPSGRVPCGLGLFGERALTEFRRLDDVLDEMGMYTADLGVPNYVRVHLPGIWKLFLIE